MNDTVLCYIKLKNGKNKKFRSKGGKNFEGPDGKVYNAPVADNHEIRELKTFLGDKRVAFYVEGQRNAIPLSKDVEWKKTAELDSDVDILIYVTKAALMEANMADAKQTATMAGVGFLALMMLFHHFF